MSELKFIETTDETIYTDILEELENGVKGDRWTSKS